MKVTLRQLILSCTLPVWLSVACVMIAMPVFCMAQATTAAPPPVVALDSPAAATISLNEYRLNIAEAAAELDDLQVTEADEMTAEEYREYVADELAYIRRKLPAAQSVNWHGTLYRADNRWLHAALDEFVATDEADDERPQRLSDINERLFALSAEIERAEQNTKAGATDKEQAKGKLAEILRRAEYQKKEASESPLQRLFKKINDFFRSLLPHRSPVGGDTARTLASGVQLLIYALSAGVILFALWRFGKYLQRRRTDGSSRKKKKRAARVVLGEEIAEDQTAADLLGEAEKLARAGNLRAAIRKGYIALLCELDERQAIRLEAHKTNRDYVRSLATQTPLYEPVKGLTDKFEYHWYGIEPAEEKDWQEFRGRYQEAVKR